MSGAGVEGGSLEFWFGVVGFEMPTRTTSLVGQEPRKLACGVLQTTGFENSQTNI